MKKISALSKRPGEPPRHVWVSNNLEALQKAVEGYIEAITVSRGDGRDLVIICNEEGKIRGMAHNVTIYGEDFVGPILVVGVDGEDFDDLPLTWQEMKTLYSEFWEV